MKNIRGLQEIPSSMRATAITIGSYDGLHLGHQKIIQQLVTQAREQQLASVVISFDPYPKEFFLGERVPRLMSWREKFLALSQLGVDYFLTIKFDHDFAQLAAEDFVQQILVDKLHAKQIIVGDDFRFGRGRQGDYHLLERLGKQLDFQVQHATTYEYLNERISSTRVRYTLQAGSMEVAKDLLGHYYYLHGTVAHGDKLGRELGFPTANINLQRRLVPLHGIYVVRVTGIDSKIYYGAANVGNRPAVDGTRVLCEVFIFDFNQQIYGQCIKVEFIHKIRDEKNYDSLAELKQAIAQDVMAAKDFLKEFNA